MKPQPLVAVQEGRYRLHQPLTENGRPELYDVVEDPGELRDLAAGEPDVVQHLQVLVQEYLEQPEPSWGGPSTVTLDDMELNQLRALGYVVDPHAPPEERAKERKTQQRPQNRKPRPSPVP
jgi:hypothetical protein